MFENYVKRSYGGINAVSKNRLLNMIRSKEPNDLSPFMKYYAYGIDPLCPEAGLYTPSSPEMEPVPAKEDIIMIVEFYKGLITQCDHNSINRFFTLINELISHVDFHIINIDVENEIRPIIVRMVSNYIDICCAVYNPNFIYGYCYAVLKSAFNISNYASDPVPTNRVVYRSTLYTIKEKSINCFK